MIAHICQLQGSVTPVPEWEFLWLSSLSPREQQSSSMDTQEKEICYYQLLHHSKETQKGNLSPAADFILKPLPQQCPFLSCSSHCATYSTAILMAGGCLARFSIIIFICTDLAAQSEISPTGRNDSRIYTYLSYYRAQAKKNSYILIQDKYTQFHQICVSCISKPPKRKRKRK